MFVVELRAKATCRGAELPSALRRKIEEEASLGICLRGARLTSLATASALALSPFRTKGDVAARDGSVGALGEHHASQVNCWSRCTLGKQWGCNRVRHRKHSHCAHNGMFHGYNSCAGTACKVRAAEEDEVTATVWT